MDNKAFLYAIEDIFSKTEIFVCYGFDYWNWFYE